MKDLEHKMQVAVFKWAKLQENVYPDLKNLFAVPNGTNCGPRVGKYMNDEGRRKGVPDIFLDVPMDDYHGLRIEMKTEKGYLSQYQKDWINRLIEKGYKVDVCRSTEQAITIIKEYLKI